MDLDDQRAPLLRTEHGADKSKEGYIYPSKLEYEGTAPKKAWWPEAKRVLRLAVPVSLSEVVSFIAYLITTAQVGRLGRLELSAVTLARSTFHITGLSLVVGVGSAVETFCGQAFGAAHYPLLGLVLQRATLMCLLACSIPLVLWVRADWVMVKVMRQHPEVVHLAAGYVRMLWPALCCWAVSGCIKNYLSSQGVVTPLSFVSCICTAATALLNHVFIFQLGLGMLGAAVAYNVAQVLELLLLVGAMTWLHVFRQAPDCRTWGGFSKQAFWGWGEYMRIALPSAAAICLDWWMYEVVVIIAGVLPDAKVQLGAMGLAFDTHALLFMLVTGFSSAAATRVSNELGAGQGRHARFAALVALGLGLCAPLGVSGGLLTAPRHWAALFTRDGHIIHLVATLMPVLTISNLADSVVAVSSGVLRGSGRQELAFKVNLAAYWFLGLPLAAYLALRKHMGAMGLWLAMGLASGLQAFILLGGILRFDWSEEARKALRRVAASEAGLLAATAAAVPVPPGPEDVVRAAAAAEQGESAGAASVLRRHDSLGRLVEADAQVPPPPPQHVVLHAGLGSRHGVHEPLLTAEHTI